MARLKTQQRKTSSNFMKLHTYYARQGANGQQQTSNADFQSRRNRVQSGRSGHNLKRGAKTYFDGHSMEGSDRAGSEFGLKEYADSCSLEDDIA